MFQCIIYHSSTKCLVPPLHKFTISKLDLFFFLFWETKFVYYHCVLADLSIFREDGKKFVPQESRIEFCQLSIVWVKKLRYEKKVQGELIGSYFHRTLEWLHPYVPTTSFRLIVLWNKVECQCYNETIIPPC